MPNRFFNNLINLVSFTKARASDVEADFSAIDVGFEMVQRELDATVRAPSGEAIDVLPPAAARAGRALVFGVSGLGWSPQVVADAAQMQAAVTAAQVAQVESAKVVYANAMSTLLFIGY